MRVMRAGALSGLCLAALTVLALVPVPAAAAFAVPDPSMLGRATAWIMEQQRAFHQELTQGLKTIEAGGGTAAAMGLVTASFLYGVFHAAGPGHGKAVLSAYLLTHKESMTRGLWLAAAAALCQGLTAIVLVYGLIGLAGWLPREASTAVAWSERLSYMLVLLLGGLLAARAARALVSAVRAGIAGPARLQHHEHEHEHGCGCGHAHTPSAEQLAGATDLRAMLGLILSIGLRPCSGAVLVLVFAHVTGLAWAGIAAVAAMSAGTALAVAGLAFLAVNARHWAVALAVGRQGRAAYRVAAALAALGGGIAIIAVGLSLMAASFAPAHPLGL
ncbi:nickel/cobalt transporter [Marinimicrococcus flavescens]|uniref:Nickel/cobalt efflux system n=1 Tax=Marinimicrococcus flavescens TaxID=3031815 RepID=A0AAP3V2N8_9PROT|nr:high frequency lysogenization protein HflD [Marinimicrococcus flavescens]